MNSFVKTGLVVALSSAVSLASFAGASAASDKADDLAASVRSEINKSVALRTDHLTVETLGGVIYVRGTVSCLDGACRRSMRGRCTRRAD